jgi:phenylalanyl-tRNA synthetase beta chain
LDIAWEVLTALAESKKKFKPLDKFQGIRRDVALLVPLDLTNEKINTTVKNFGSPIIRNALPFDLYKGKGIPDGKKSVAYAVWYFNPDRTLTDDEVSETHTRLVAFLKDKLGAEVR